MSIGKHNIMDMISRLRRDRTFADATLEVAAEDRVGVINHLAFALLHTRVVGMISTCAAHGYSIAVEHLATSIVARRETVMNGRIERREVTFDFRLHDSAITVTFASSGNGSCSKPWTPPYVFNEDTLAQAAGVLVFEATSFLVGAIDGPRLPN